jgi:hypothetical protein
LIKRQLSKPFPPNEHEFVSHFGNEGSGAGEVSLVAQVFYQFAMRQYFVGRMVLGVLGFGDVELLHPVHDRNVGNPKQPFDFTVAQTFDVELQGFGHVVGVYALAKLVYGEIKIAGFALMSLSFSDDATFHHPIRLAFRALDVVHLAVYRFFAKI